MYEENRKLLEALKERFNRWLHIDDYGTLYTLAASKISHKLPGPTIWAMLIGASAGGKTAYLKALTTIGEISIDDLTKNSMLSGYKSHDTDENSQFADKIKNNIWYIYDLSMLMSKHHEERSAILSQLRMIYDGKLTKPYGTKKVLEADTSHNTLICASTPAIDRTLLEDQILGTRFIQYRMPPGNRKLIMDIIDQTRQDIVAMDGSLKRGVADWWEEIRIDEYEPNEAETEALHRLSEIATILRTSVDVDKSGEPANIATSEEPGRFYNQIRKMYSSYRILGLTEEESIPLIRKLCIDNINPIRLKLLKYLDEVFKRDKFGEGLTTSQIHSNTGVGKKAIKTHLHSLNMIGIVDFKCKELGFGRVEDRWRLLDTNLHLVFADGYKDYAGKSLARIYNKFRTQEMRKLT